MTTEFNFFFLSRQPIAKNMGTCIIDNRKRISRPKRSPSKPPNVIRKALFVILYCCSATAYVKSFTKMFRFIDALFSIAVNFSSETNAQFSQDGRHFLEQSLSSDSV